MVMILSTFKPVVRADIVECTGHAAVSFGASVFTASATL
jgi:hypothetical protein